MRMNQGVEWAAHACVLLAPLWPEHGLSLAALAEYHGLPLAYMAKQMQQLSKAGLVRTSRGKTGGYALSRAPGEITLWDITGAIDGALPMFRCSEIRQRGPCAARRESCARPCGIAASFAAAEEAYRTALKAVSIADMLAEAASEYGPKELSAMRNWFGARITTLPVG